MIDGLTIRGEQPSDYDGIAAVVSSAFGREDEARLIAKIRKLPGFDPALRWWCPTEFWSVTSCLLTSSFSSRRATGCRPWHTHRWLSVRNGNDQGSVSK